jgi:hypothetical protein
MILDALEKQLHDTANTNGGKWINELPNALEGFVLNLPCRQGSRLTSWSMASKLSYPPT